jgi:hypothetical protein
LAEITKARKGYEDYEGYEKSKNRGIELIDSLDDNDTTTRFDWSIDFAAYILRTMPSDSDLAKQYLDSVSDLAEDDINKSRLYNLYAIYYGEVGNNSKVDEYIKKINDLTIIENQDKDGVINNGK